MAQCFVGHYRAEVGAADTDVDNVTDGLAGVPLPLPAANAVGEVRHFIEHRVDVWYDVFVVDDDRCPSGRPQGNVQNRAVLCDVDLVAAEHRVDASSQTALLSQLDEQPHRLVGDAVLRIV